MAILVGVRRYDCDVVRSVALILAWLPGSRARAILRLVKAPRRITIAGTAVSRLRS
ncbi:MAG TPA: hypothetical protein VJO33_20500 [Gemmatimonadaceae bacterium]|nr:hypothetical protein [Gemmatimonadaceae bacterium]